jgi:protein-disulfide isomerase
MMHWLTSSIIKPRALCQGRRRFILATASVLAACGSRTPDDFERLWTQVQGVTTGPAAPAAGGLRLLVFFDTRCGFCTQLWHNLQPVMASWQMLWVPVAILAPASRDEALALLSSGDRLAWLQAHMNRRPLPPVTPDAGLESVLATNLDALEGLPGGMRSVPQTVGMKGQGMHVVRGALPLDRLQAEFG